MRHPRFQRLAILAFLALLTTAPLMAAGYVIYLKDGSRIAAKEKYRIENGRALITLPNGTQSFVPAGQIDVRRTDEANRDGYGGAVVLPGASQDLSAAATQPVKDKTLADLIAARDAAPRELPKSRREKSEPTPGHLLKTKAGFYDLATLARKPYPHGDVTSALQQFFRGQGLEGVEIYEGTRADRTMIEISTNSEGSVFKALTTASNALLHIRGLFPDRVAALELLLTTPSRERAGQFVLTPDMATDLISKKVDVTSFFVKNVQF
ncbi:MAG TPA: hypothetical protein VKK31_18935 [Thermoanaerobaculia bacterium]|nr:hypothetical protein [Thermoanaerobaculia bacterium]